MDFNHLLSQYEALPHDIILIIEAHGQYDQKKGMSVMLPPMPCTFLVASTFGTIATSIVSPTTRHTFNVIKENITNVIDYYDVQHFDKQLQRTLRLSYKKYKKNRKRSDTYSPAYRHDVGWHLSTSQGYYERQYFKDEDLPSVNVVFSKLGGVVNTKSFQHRDIFDDVYRNAGRSLPTRRERAITRSEILAYLKLQGYHNVLIIDSSCSDTATLKHLSSREVRAVKRATRRKGIAF